MKNPILPLLLAGLALMMTTGCADRGCTDPAAENYDPFAQSNNGTCVYRGCTDPNATNYNPEATISDGNCTYPVVSGEVSFWSSVQCCAIEVSLNGQILDTINDFYSNNPGCVNGNGIVRISRTPGSYIVSAEAITGTQGYIWQDTITIIADDCLTYEFGL